MEKKDRKTPLPPKPPSPEIGVVVPVYRNAGTLDELHRRLRDVLESRSLSYEILFVDDACPAGSLEVLEELTRRNSSVSVLALGRNVGQHRAVLIGLENVTGGRLVALDADLQDPPEAIPALLDKLGEGHGVVFAGRRGRYESSSRLLTSFVLKGLLHLLSDMPRDAGMFFALDRETAGRLLDFHAPRPHLPSMLGCTGRSMASVPVRRIRRPDGESAWSFRMRLETGVRAVAWVISQRLGLDRRAREGESAAGTPIETRLGTRFTGRLPKTR